MNQSTQQPCRCKTLQKSSSKGGHVKYRCQCGQTNRVIKMNAEQRKEQNALFSLKSKGSIHELYHKYTKAFGNEDGTIGLKHAGYDFMTKMQKFAEKNPAIIRVGVDDSYHCGSDVYLIPHEDKDMLWGVTVLYIPQCSGEKPIEFFLYPGHLKHMIAGLETMATNCRKHGNRNLDSIWRKKSTVPSLIPSKIKLADVLDMPEDFPPLGKPTKAQIEAQKNLQKLLKKQAREQNFKVVEIELKGIGMRRFYMSVPDAPKSKAKKLKLQQKIQTMVNNDVAIYKDNKLTVFGHEIGTRLEDKV